MTFQIKHLLAGIAAIAFVLWPVIGSAEEKEVVILMPNGYPASDALQPSGNALGPLDDYAKILNIAFAEAFATSVRIRYVFESVFPGSEGVVWISENDGRFRLSRLQSTRWLWQYTPGGRSQAVEFHQKLFADFRKVRLKRCSTDIPPSLAIGIIAVWRSMLRQARWPERPGTRGPDDGSTYYSMTDNGRIFAGEIPPYNGTQSRPKIELFSNLAGEMEVFCESRGSAHLENMRKDVSDLSRLLAPGTPR